MPASSRKTRTRIEVLQDIKPAFWDGTRINLPPTFSWGGRIGAAPPNQRYPGWLNINRTQDVAISVTKIAGRHSMKAGFYNNHSFKAQNIGRHARSRVRRTSATTPTTRSTPASATPTPRSGVFTQYRQALEVRRGQHALQQHRVLRPGQLEGEQPADDRLRRALHAPAAAVRPVPADVELLPRRVESAARRRCSTSPAAATARSPAPATSGTR